MSTKADYAQANLNRLVEQLQTMRLRGDPPELTRPMQHLAQHAMDVVERMQAGLEESTEGAERTALAESTVTGE